VDLSLYLVSTIRYVVFQSFFAVTLCASYLCLLSCRPVSHAQVSETVAQNHEVPQSFSELRHDDLIEFNFYAIVTPKQSGKGRLEITFEVAISGYKLTSAIKRLNQPIQMIRDNLDSDRLYDLSQRFQLPVSDIIQAWRTAIERNDQSYPMSGVNHNDAILSVYVRYFYKSGFPARENVDTNRYDIHLNDPRILAAMSEPSGHRFTNGHLSRFVGNPNLKRVILAEHHTQEPRVYLVRSKVDARDTAEEIARLKAELQMKDDIIRALQLQLDRQCQDRK
jgi:hypothetical protein